MTNYEELFRDQMKNPQFVKAYYEARVERIFDEMLETLKNKIVHNESKEKVILLIDSFQRQIHTIVPQEPASYHKDLNYG